jgi:hypothetical protein
MGATSRTAPYIRFAVISAIVIAVASAGFALFAAQNAYERERAASARESAALVAEPLRAYFDPADKSVPLAGPPADQLNAALLSLFSGTLESVRVTSSGGVTLFQAGVPIADRPPDALPSRITYGQANSIEGKGLFVTRVRNDDYTIELAQDAGPVNAAAASARMRFVAAALAFGAVAWLIAQSVFALVARPLMRDHGRLMHLYVTGEQLRSSVDLHDVLTQLAQDATNLGGGNYGLVALFDEATSEVLLRATFERESGTVSLHQRPIDEWFIRRSIATNTTIVTTMPDGGGRMFFGADAVVERDAPLLCSPMAIRDRVVGAIAVVGSSSGRGNFSPSDVRQIQQLCGQAVTAVEQSMLFAKVRADANEIEASYDSTLKALMAALDAKDEVTEGHCERVAKVTIQLARQMDLPDSMLVHIERGAMLHDVGKIGVPDEVLKKPAALTDAEWDTMRKHPMLAGLMVSKVGFLEPAMPILLYHHERFDGSGYPFGLAGENIPVEARIFTVVDAYDAMTQDRPYRNAMTHEEAMDELRANAGTQFDPDVVAAFEHLVHARPDLRGGAVAERRALGLVQQDIDVLHNHDHHDEEGHNLRLDTTGDGEHAA